MTPDIFRTTPHCLVSCFDVIYSHLLSLLEFKHELSNNKYYYLCDLSYNTFTLHWVYQSSIKKNMEVVLMCMFGNQILTCTVLWLAT